MSESANGPSNANRKDRYDDSWGRTGNDLMRREEEVASVLPKLFEPKDIGSGRKILEIGSGTGAETKALKKWCEQNPVVALDRDPRAAKAASQNGVAFIELDLERATDEEILKIIRTHNIGGILALRTSGVIAERLANLIDSNKFDGICAFSLITATDSQAINKFRWKPGVMAKQIGSDDPFMARMTGGETAFIFKPSNKDGVK